MDLVVDNTRDDVAAGSVDLQVGIRADFTGDLVNSPVPDQQVAAENAAPVDQKGVADQYCLHAKCMMGANVRVDAAFCRLKKREGRLNKLHTRNAPVCENQPFLNNNKKNTLLFPEKMLKFQLNGTYICGSFFLLTDNRAFPGISIKINEACFDDVLLRESTEGDFF